MRPGCVLLIKQAIKMNHNQRNTVLSLAVALCAPLAGAVPAYPGIINAVQPDGTEVALLSKGDEHHHWAATPDGFTLLRDSEGYWTFAREGDNGAVPSDIVYRGSSAPAVAAMLKPGLKVSQPASQARTRAQAGAGLQVDESFPSTGNRRLLVLLVNYGDTRPVYSREDFDAMMNAEGYNGTGSFRDYYREASYGKLDIATTVTRWVTVPYPKSYYGSEGAVNLIRDALFAIDDEIDLREFDNDGDGILDGLAVIHQGAGQEATSRPDDIWSHSSSISGMEFDGIQVRRYTIEPELLGTTGEISTIGVVCHEFGHNLGAPDFYDTDYGSSGGEFPGTGVWDLMGSGAWNGDKGDRPAGINMWQKIQLGWCQPVHLTASTSVSGMAPADSEPVAYRFDTTVPGEYFILENRQRNGHFDSALPGHGLIIYHVNEAMIRRAIEFNRLNVEFPQAIYTVCAGALGDPDNYPTSYGDVNGPGAPFPGATSKTSFDDNSSPSAKSVDGRFSYKAVSDIAEDADGYISFRFTAGEAPVAPVNLVATANRGIVRLSWQLPESDETLRHFSIYRNAELIATTTATEYIDEGVTAETNIEYYVDATYDSGFTSPYAATSVRIPRNFVSELTASIDGDAGTVALSWSLGTRLSRNTSMEASEVVDYNVGSLDYVHRFTSAELSVFKGYKIRRIGFMPYQGPRDVKFTLRVWESDDDGSNPRIISERAISEFGSLTWNDLLLSKTVEIDAEKQLWLGVHCETTKGLIKIINDKSGDGAGRGNWIKIGDGPWQVDDQTTGNYYLRFTLVEPSISEPAPIPSIAGTVDPAVDLAFPLGFTVYRDNEPIGSTGNRLFIDRAPLSGTHTYSVASCYKGGNESVASNVDVEYNYSGITAPVGLDNDVLAVVTDGGALILPGYSGPLSVIDVLGRVAARIPAYEAGTPVYLAPDLYIISTLAGCRKVALR